MKHGLGFRSCTALLLPLIALAGCGGGSTNGAGDGYLTLDLDEQPRN